MHIQVREECALVWGVLYREQEEILSSIYCIRAITFTKSFQKKRLTNIFFMYHYIMNIIPNKSIILAALVASIALAVWKKQEVHSIIDAWNLVHVISGKEKLMREFMALSSSGYLCDNSSAIQAPVISSVDRSSIFALYPDDTNNRWNYIVRNIDSPEVSVEFRKEDLTIFFPSCISIINPLK